MGIINKDIYTTNHGIELTNTYICIGNNAVRLSKINEKKFLISVDYHIYYNFESRISQKDGLSKLSFDFEIFEDSLEKNIYYLAYEQLKIIFPKYEEV